MHVNHSSTRGTAIAVFLVIICSGIFSLSRSQKDQDCLKKSYDRLVI